MTTKKVEAAIKRELHVLAQRSSAVERTAYCSINDVHSLAAKYDGSISDKDAETKGVLISMSIDQRFGCCVPAYQYCMKES